jgi:hypothetical protein
MRLPFHLKGHAGQEGCRGQRNFHTQNFTVSILAADSPAEIDTALPTEQLAAQTSALHPTEEGLNRALVEKEPAMIGLGLTNSFNLITQGQVRSRSAMIVTVNTNGKLALTMHGQRFFHLQILLIGF